MSIIYYDQSKPFENARFFQDEIVDSMSLQLATKGLQTISAFYNSQIYYVIKFDIEHNFEECRKIAIKLSQYPNIFLGQRRTELQINDAIITISVNNWVECEELPNCHLGFSVQYYIHTYNNMPNTIFFRIKYSEDMYEEKIKYFIDGLLDRNMIEFNKYHTCIQLDQDQNSAITPYNYFKYDITDVEVTRCFFAVTVMVGGCFVLTTLV